MKKDKCFKYLILGVVLVGLFFLIYAPHQGYRFPIHADEWHHITETIKLGNGEYEFIGRDGIRTMGFEVGFHVFLLAISQFVNLIFFYKFLPAIWMVISALVLFFVVYKKFNNYWIALLSIIFFGSIKSNVNILGMWFFTPLTFAIPFIFLFIYFFTEGFERKSKKFILISLAIMIFLLFVHAVSFLFAIPLLLIYGGIHYKYLLEEYRFFLIFLLVPLIGFVFYFYMEGLGFLGSLFGIFNDLQFRHGWNMNEINNSLFEIYSFAGYLFAFLGFGILAFRKRKKYLIYLLWPISVLVFIIAFRIFGVSFFSPYQRNLYYFALSLPILSSVGMYYLLRDFGEGAKEVFNSDLIRKILVVFVALIIFALVFGSYFSLSERLKVPILVDEVEYDALVFLSGLERTTILAEPDVSVGFYPIAGHDPFATLFFYGDKETAIEFLDSRSCEVRQEILNGVAVGLVFLDEEVDCGWELIYDRGVYIYGV